ncbi:hypothetical protein [Prosthecobacter vanneervenii]|uniref:Uncharacterized protein n=1 Tax=Prosthecobacter vanneervenii TaxID=48466 RepID=A0A7W7Y7V7_9BACT|nr:hypothetical protein [Prosthecobacter vanneervenii]MBB5030840.1 hypothetical protein [Prosthecobacter vanneervenii]
MNDSELESLLRGLSPAKASPALMRRVDEELQLDMSWLGSTAKRPARRAPRWISSVSWAAMGAAAAVTVMSWLPQPAQSTATLAAAQPSPAVMPVSTSTTSLREWEEDESPRYSRKQSADKHFIVVSREMQTWGDPRYGAQTTMEISSKNKLLVPVTFH